MKYPLNPKERVGLIAISLLILANIGWLLAHKSVGGDSGKGTAPETTVVLPSDSTDNAISSADTMAAHRHKTARDRKSHKKKSPTKARRQRPPLPESSPAPRDFLRDTIPTRRT